MQAFIAIIFAFMALQIAAQYTKQSAPFYLVVVSNNSTYSGATLKPCHEGAAIEGLCLGDMVSPTSQTYTFNTSANANDTEPDSILGLPGTLNYELEGENFKLSSPLQITADITTNVAAVRFVPSGGTPQIGFDDKQQMFVFMYFDDTVDPPEYKTQPLYRWMVCNMNAEYSYITLAWLVGQGRAQNPSCKKVRVRRQFV